MRSQPMPQASLFTRNRYPVSDHQWGGVGLLESLQFTVSVAQLRNELLLIPLRNEELTSDRITLDRALGSGDQAVGFSWQPESALEAALSRQGSEQHG